MHETSHTSTSLWSKLSYQMLRCCVACAFPYTIILPTSNHTANLALRVQQSAVGTANCDRVREMCKTFTSYYLKFN